MTPPLIISFISFRKSFFSFLWHRRMSLRYSQSIFDIPLSAGIGISMAWEEIEYFDSIAFLSTDTALSIHKLSCFTASRVSREFTKMGKTFPHNGARKNRARRKSIVIQMIFPMTFIINFRHLRFARFRRGKIENYSIRRLFLARFKRFPNHFSRLLLSCSILISRTSSVLRCWRTHVGDILPHTRICFMTPKLISLDVKWNFVFFEYSRK